MNIITISKTPSKRCVYKVLVYFHKNYLEFNLNHLSYWLSKFQKLVWILYKNYQYVLIFNLNLGLNNNQ